jgi:hypothetical protein
LQASSAICSMAPTPTSTFTTTACGQMFTANDFLNWGAPVNSGGLGQAIDPSATDIGTSADVTTPNFGVGIDVTADNPDDNLVRADNTAYAWDATSHQWVYPTIATGFSNTINTFAGQFNAPSCQQPTTTCEVSTPPYGPYDYPYQFGDPLLGSVGRSGDAEMTFSFTQGLYGVAFEVSSKTAANFIATLDAYDSSGDLLGVYQVNATGSGGVCNTLTGFLMGGPTPCNDAPLIQFYDPDGRIASVVLTVNDTGAYVDEMSLDVSSFSDASTPEPQTAPLIGLGLIVIALAARRVTRSRRNQEIGRQA